jgi:hypothetical protein
MKMKNSVLILSVCLIFISAFTGAILFLPEEGMFPLSEIHKLDLNKAGLKISVDEVYNPNGVSIVDGLVNVGGCSGSFISDEGLIITNHHCVFDAVQKASTLETNYVESGFLAKTRDEEIIAEGLTCRITDSYEDVSEIILKTAEDEKDINKRIEAIEKKIKEIVKEEEAKDSTLRIVVSEMFTGQSYVLFRYKTINDVRLVYVPPKSIGEFGGDSDNWIWPRHTGDFSFVRAYVAPDGSPAKYSPDNIPFKPKKHLKVNPDGVQEGDFIFVMGYPGRTFKNQPSDYLVYQERFLLPYIAEFYRWLINLLEEDGKADPEFELKSSSKIKSLANVRKNFEGKIQGLKRLNIVKKKQEEDAKLQEYINSNNEFRDKYGNVISSINEIYYEIYDEGRISLIFNMLRNNVTLYRLAELLIDYHNEMKKPESERRESLSRNNIDKIAGNLYTNHYPEVDRKIMNKILTDAAYFPETSVYDIFQRILKEDLVENLYNKTVLDLSDEFYSMLDMTTESFGSVNDPFITFVKNCKEAVLKLEDAKKIRDGKLNLLIPQYLEAKKLWLDKSFIPDANSTLRLTYGYIKGYSPSDAVYYSPITTLKGVIEKGRDKGEFKIPDKLVELYNKKDFGRFKDKKLNDVPVAILYNTDTSGGNSGSPVLNAYGEIVGINFDRAYEATINDFTWSEDYSRSIGVDIRYVLWVTQKIGGAGFLLEEMGVF